MRKQQTVLVIAIILTVLAAALGLVFSFVVSTGLTRPVRRLLEGARAVEAGRLDETLAITSQDEIGHLTIAFNSMVEQLRVKERIRETFGRYVDPRIVERLISGAALATEGQRRVMTVLFCDVKGFVGVSEEMTPQGLVKVMNGYFSTMSAPIHRHGGIIDKYIGDAIMAYWGPPFTADADQAQFAGLAALDMLDRVEPFREELPNLLGLKNVPISFDIRIGIATGEALVGSIGSEVMMSYTVMGDTVNLASRLEGANKLYGGRILASEPTVVAAGAAIETREIDRVVLVGQSHSQPIYEIMSRGGGLTPKQTELRAALRAGLAAYRDRRWDEARKAFAAALEADPARRAVRWPCSSALIFSLQCLPSRLGRRLASRAEINAVRRRRGKVRRSSLQRRKSADPAYIVRNGGAAMAKLNGKTALITGSTDGVGRVVAKRLGEAGWRVLVHGRDRGRGERVVAEITDAGGSAEFLVADLSSLADVRRLADAVQKTAPNGSISSSTMPASAAADRKARGRPAPTATNCASP